MRLFVSRPVFQYTRHSFESRTVSQYCAPLQYIWDPCNKFAIHLVQKRPMFLGSLLIVATSNWGTAHQLHHVFDCTVSQCCELLQYIWVQPASLYIHLSHAQRLSTHTMYLINELYLSLRQLRLVDSLKHRSLLQKSPIKEKIFCKKDLYF